MNRVTRPLGLFCAVLSLSLAGGCGPVAKPTGELKGSISYKGTPITLGNVDIRSESGVAAQGTIVDGTYTFADPVEAGEYQVAVSPPVPEPQPPGTPPPPAVTFDIPPKFQGLTTSGVKITVKEGPNDIPIEFKD